MSIDRDKFVIAVSILLIKNNQVFMTRRQNTDWENGKFNLPGGHVEIGETITQAAIREASEEAGVKINSNDLTFVNVSHLVTNSPRVHLYFKAENWEGEPFNAEPEKASEAGWFDIDNLPRDTIDIFQEALKNYKENIKYSEFGWNK